LSEPSNGVVNVCENTAEQLMSIVLEVITKHWVHGPVTVNHIITEQTLNIIITVTLDNALDYFK